MAAGVHDRKEVDAIERFRIVEDARRSALHSNDASALIDDPLAYAFCDGDSNPSGVLLLSLSRLREYCSSRKAQLCLRRTLEVASATCLVETSHTFLGIEEDTSRKFAEVLNKLDVSFEPDPLAVVPDRAAPGLGILSSALEIRTRLATTSQTLTAAPSEPSLSPEGGSPLRCSNVTRANPHEASSKSPLATPLRPHLPEEPTDPCAQLEAATASTPPVSPARSSSVTCSPFSSSVYSDISSDENDEREEPPPNASRSLSRSSFGPSQDESLIEVSDVRSEWEDKERVAEISPVMASDVDPPAAQPPAAALSCDEAPSCSEGSAASLPQEDDAECASPELGPLLVPGLLSSPEPASGEGYSPLLTPRRVSKALEAMPLSTDALDEILAVQSPQKTSPPRQRVNRNRASHISAAGNAKRSVAEHQPKKVPKSQSVVRSVVKRKARPGPAVAKKKITKSQSFPTTQSHPPVTTAKENRRPPLANDGDGKESPDVDLLIPDEQSPDLAADLDVPTRHAEDRDVPATGPITFDLMKRLLSEDERRGRKRRRRDSRSDASARASPASRSGSVRDGTRRNKRARTRSRSRGRDRWRKGLGNRRTGIVRSPTRALLRSQSRDRIRRHREQARAINRRRFSSGSTSPRRASQPASGSVAVRRSTGEMLEMPSHLSGSRVQRVAEHPFRRWFAEGREGTAHVPLHRHPQMRVTLFQPDEIQDLMRSQAAHVFKAARQLSAFSSEDKTDVVLLGDVPPRFAERRAYATYTDEQYRALYLSDQEEERHKSDHREQTYWRHSRAEVSFDGRKYDAMQRRWRGGARDHAAVLTLNFRDALLNNTRSPYGDDVWRKADLLCGLGSRLRAPLPWNALSRWVLDQHFARPIPLHSMLTGHFYFRKDDPRGPPYSDTGFNCFLKELPLDGPLKHAVGRLYAEYLVLIPSAMPPDIAALVRSDFKRRSPLLPHAPGPSAGASGHGTRHYAQVRTGEGGQEAAPSYPESGSTVPHLPVGGGWFPFPLVAQGNRRPGPWPIPALPPPGLT